MNLPFLTPQEIQALTDKQRRQAQIRALNAMGIQHKVRHDGSIAILTVHVQKAFGEGSSTALRSKEILPNWAAL